jgi:CTP synthase
MKPTEFYSPVPLGYQNVKYVIVFGTVMSGLGKGVFSSSLAKIIQECGFTVAPIKLEGYLNRDSGTLNPLRHGEVFVLDDGTECDMDLGTYERMLDQNLSHLNFATNGQFLSNVLDKERRGEYLGRDVQIIPHVTGEVKHRLRELSVKTKADIIFVEVGGTIGDLENEYYIEALRELAYEEPGSCCFIALTHIYRPSILNEQKSKPAQLGLRSLLAKGISPDIIACRSSEPVDKQILEKISLYVGTPLEHVFSMHDMSSLNCIPALLAKNGVHDVVMKILKLKNRKWKPDPGWLNYTKSVCCLSKRIVIGITGKYISVRDSYASIIQALEHAGVQNGVEVKIKWVDTELVTEIKKEIEQLDGIIVPGGFGSRGTEGKIQAIQIARELKMPILGLCYGFQLMAIEFARNVCRLDNANTTEIDENSQNPVIHLRGDQKNLSMMGATMHLGGKDVVVDISDVNARLPLYYSSGTARYRFRHRYEFNTAYWKYFTDAGMIFSGMIDGVPQVIELPKSVHPFFIATQAHAELTSRPLKPDPLFSGLVTSILETKNP